MSRVRVFFTVDVEIWPGGWDNIDARFPQAFKDYVYGDTRFGQYGLPFKLKVLGDHGLTGVFFVESMFSARFGLEPLQEVVGLIKDAHQEIQLHLHAEWVNEARVPILSRMPSCRIQHLSHFSLEDQVNLIAWSKRRLLDAGAPSLTAFRAGNFASNLDTLRALEANGIYIDTSYNHYYRDASSEVFEGASRQEVPNLPFMVGNVLEIPVTVYRDFPFHLRPLQLTACSLDEMITVLRKAADGEHAAVVIVSHNAELLDRRNFSRDEVVVRRFLGLCEFLSRHDDCFETSGFLGARCDPRTHQPAPLAGSIVATGIRYVEQLGRRLHIPAMRKRW